MTSGEEGRNLEEALADLVSRGRLKMDRVGLLDRVKIIGQVSEPRFSIDAFKPYPIVHF